jgi:biotin transport system substrate-specific component
MEVPVLLGFNVLLAVCSYISFNLPLSPVPITGQTFGVLLVALALGRVRASAVVLAYLLEGSAGLPVFAGGSAGLAKLMGLTGGYLIGFLVAAYVVGTLADRGWDRTYLRSGLAMVIGTAIIFVAGLSQLALFIPSEALLAAGLIPFIPGAIIKIATASAVLPSVWKFLDRSH